MSAWAVVALTGALTVLLKGAGPVGLGGRRLPPRLLAVTSLLAPALLAALVVTQVFGATRRLVVDERALGLVVAALALRCRAPLLAVVVLAAATTAVARAL